MVNHYVSLAFFELGFEAQRLSFFVVLFCLSLFVFMPDFRLSRSQLHSSMTQPVVLAASPMIHAEGSNSANASTLREGEF
jgi:hypothetical protein